MTFVCALERSERPGRKRCHGQCPSCATWWPEKKPALKDYGLPPEIAERVRAEAERIVNAHLDGSEPRDFGYPIDFTAVAGQPTWCRIVSVGGELAVVDAMQLAAQLGMWPADQAWPGCLLVVDPPNAQPSD